MQSEAHKEHKHFLLIYLVSQEAFDNKKAWNKIATYKFSQVRGKVKS